jgi:hypothetical protein
MIERRDRTRRAPTTSDAGRQREVRHIGPAVAGTQLAATFPAKSRSFRAEGLDEQPGRGEPGQSAECRRG